jgi:hypothetical protein
MSAAPLNHRDDRRCLLAVLGGLALLYGLLLSPHWSAGPDTAYYQGIARSLLAGRGYEFNGGPVGRAPPGWPLVLAGAMSLSRSYVFLGAVNAGLLLAAAAGWYRILRRLVEPRRAMWTMLLCGTLYWWYASAVQLRSEALFTAIMAGAVLLALQIAEGRRGAWRIALLLAACASLVAIRFAGAIAWTVIAAALLHGISAPAASGTGWWPHLGRRLILPAATLAVMVGAFIGVRWLLQEVLPHYVTPRPRMLEGAFRIPGLDAFDREEGAAPAMTAVIGGGTVGLYAGRALSAGQWLAGTFWMPLQVLDARRGTALVVNIFGWGLIAVVLAGAWRTGVGRSFLILGAAIYCQAIITRWSNVNTRYLMPVAPLLLVGFWLGLEVLFERFELPWRRVVLGLWIGAVACTNLGLWTVDAWIARSGRFYELFNAGELRQLTSVSHYLLTRGLQDGEVATNNFIISATNRQRTNGYAHRGLVALTDLGINVIPNQMEVVRGKGGTTRKADPARPPEERKLQDWQALIRDGRPDNPCVAQFMAFRKIRFYVYRPPGGSHAWHFRRSQLPTWLGGKPGDSRGWELYELVDGVLVRVSFPLVDDWPRAVPG